MSLKHTVPAVAQCDASPFADTGEAANYLKLQSQTLRRWACTQTGPIQPVRIGNRALRWRWADLHELAGG